MLNDIHKRFSNKEDLEMYQARIIKSMFIMVDLAIVHSGSQKDSSQVLVNIIKKASGNRSENTNLLSCLDVIFESVVEFCNEEISLKNKN